MSERIGPYEIVTQIGEGGMGQVYRATDTRLDRTVAIKRLKSGFSERFEREARAISALNHPHIATLHDVGDDYLVMEYVDGKPLAGPLALDKALEYAKQILSALEAAHKLGIVHRDLKPANILVTKAGVKLLDFGLAKMRPKASAAAAEHTMTLALTGEHTILGTPQYMAPEQIEGHEADARSDIFAFGCVLYEMLTGKRAFDGKSASSVMAAVLAAEPRPLRELVPVVPERLDKVLRACLAKDPDERWQSAADLRREFEWLALPEQKSTAARRPFAWLPWAIAAAAVVACSLAVVQLNRASTENEQTAFMLTGPWASVYLGQGGMAVSPDGKKLALIASTSEGTRGIWMRDLSQPQPKLLLPSTTATGLFWSPDSASLGYAAGTELRTVEVSSGETRTIATGIATFRGASWSTTGEIVYAHRGAGPLLVVRPGEQPRPALPGSDAGFHGWPWFLPDGKNFLYVNGDTTNGGVYVASVGASRGKKLLDVQAAARYANGHLLWSGSGLIARPFDPQRLEFSGGTVQLVGNVGVIGRFSLFGVSDRTLAFYSQFVDTTRISWIDPSTRGQKASKEGTAHAEVSPDGKTIVYSRDNDLWLWDLASGADSRLTFSPGNDWVPAWTPDGKWVVWAGQRDGSSWQLFRKRVDGTGSEEQLTSYKSYLHHLHISPDGTSAAVECGTPAVVDVCLFTFADRAIRPLMQTSQFSEIHPQFSPDGKWLAFASNSSGKMEVYVYAFPSMSGPWQISVGGGVQPRWRADGNVLYYLNHRSEIVSVEVTPSGPAFRWSPTQQKVLATDIEPMTPTSHFAAAPGGTHFLITERPGADQLYVIRNWSGLLKR